MSHEKPLKPLNDCSMDVTPEHDSIILPRINDPQFNPAILLKQREGSLIKDLIDRHSPGNFRQYCSKIGMSPPNFHAILNGDRKCSLETLNKVLSGIKYEARVSTTITIQAMPTGLDANDVYLPPDEESWPFEKTEVEHLDKPQTSDSSLSDQPPTKPTPPQGSLLVDLPEEFFNLHLS